MYQLEYLIFDYNNLLIPINIQSPDYNLSISERKLPGIILICLIALRGIYGFTSCLRAFRVGVKKYCVLKEFFSQDQDMESLRQTSLLNGAIFSIRATL